MVFKKYLLFRNPWICLRHFFSLVVRFCGVIGDEVREKQLDSTFLDPSLNKEGVLHLLIHIAETSLISLRGVERGTVSKKINGNRI